MVLRGQNKGQLSSLSRRLSQNDGLEESQQGEARKENGKGRTESTGVRKAASTQGRGVGDHQSPCCVRMKVSAGVRRCAHLT